MAHDSEKETEGGTIQKSVSLSPQFIEHAEKIAKAQHRSLSNLLGFAIYQFFNCTPTLDESKDN